MERRGEGFERERIPEQGPEPRYREGVERERIIEPRHGEAVERERVAEPRYQGVERERVAQPRPTEPMATYDERYGQLEPGIVFRARDLTRWGPVIGGFFASLSVMVLLGTLGAAIGLQLAGGIPTTGVALADAGVGAAIYGAITLIVSFFVGGWLAGRTAAVAGPNVGLIHGFAVWALTISLVVIMGAVGFAGVLGSMISAGAAPVMPGANAIVAGWGTFVALCLGLAAALLGGWIGGNNILELRRPAR